MSKPDDPVREVQPKLTADRLLSDTLAIPERVRASFDSLVEVVDRTLKDVDVQVIDAIMLGGSGDLYHSALATEFAFERLIGVRTTAVPSMALGLFRARSLTSRSVVIQMSFSGKTARAVEAASLARAAGARVWALTHDAASPLAQIGELCFVKPETGKNEAAGYPVTMLMLYLIAVKVAELRGCLSRAGASALRDQLAGAASDMKQTLDQCMTLARDLAERFIGANHVLFLSTGPTFGSAVNGSARILEAVGLNSAAQDIEEWAHLNRWVEETTSPCFVIAPGGPIRERTAEILSAMTALEKPAIAIVPDHDIDLGNKATAWLPVHCVLADEFSPLVYNLPGELFAHLLGVAQNANPYRNNIDTYRRLGEIRWGGFIRWTLPEARIGRALSD
jgi:glucosamine--fructose-6-phosphate aminotransferase (isomerizing)